MEILTYEPPATSALDRMSRWGQASHLFGAVASSGL
jgi:hypothetical protein